MWNMLFKKSIKKELGMKNETIRIIKKENKDKITIKPFNEENINPNSYNYALCIMEGF